MNTADAQLRLVFWELTGRCNLMCRHCRGGRADMDTEDLPAEQVLEVGSAIRQAGDPVLILTGGEPLLRADFFQLANKLTQHFSRVALATNGTLIDKKTAQRIGSSGIVRVAVSLDGAEPSTHDSFRGVEGAFTGAVKGIRNLIDAGVSVQINVTVTKDNYGQLGSLLDKAAGWGVDAFHLFVLVPVGCGVNIGGEHQISGELSEEILRWTYEKSQQLGDTVNIKATCAPQYYRIMKQVSGENKGDREGVNAVTRGCLAGTNVCFVSKKGDVQPCGYLPVKAGNVFETPFVDIWQNSDLFGSLRDVSNLKGKCGKCEYVDVCGGCRAQAYARYGDYLREDPCCVYTPGSSG